METCTNVAFNRPPRSSFSRILLLLFLLFCHDGINDRKYYCKIPFSQECFPKEIIFYSMAEEQAFYDTPSISEGFDLEISDDETFANGRQSMSVSESIHIDHGMEFDFDQTADSNEPLSPDEQQLPSNDVDGISHEVDPDINIRADTFEVNNDVPPIETLSTVDVTGLSDFEDMDVEGFVFEKEISHGVVSRYASLLDNGVYFWRHRGHPRTIVMQDIHMTSQKLKKFFYDAHFGGCGLTFSEQRDYSCLETFKHMFTS